ncbi:MAG: hypothetical protein OXH93_19560 [Caldilineaceae bacterium]|nr:hypothetical protein [Caldilineaceae bacterium]
MKTVSRANRPFSRESDLHETTAKRTHRGLEKEELPAIHRPRYCYDDWD